MITAVLGAQWGDEGKGKIVDYLGEHADVIVRFNGGANAGHTIIIDGVKYVVHLLPSGIKRANAVNVVGKQVAIDLDVLKTEIGMALSSVALDFDCPIVLPFHKQLDGAQENVSGNNAIGTTKRGIGPIFGDYWGRYNLCLKHLKSKDEIKKALDERDFYNQKSVLVKHYGLVPLSVDEIVEWAYSFNFVKDYLADTRLIVFQAISKNKNVLFEGAQGVMLDRVSGTFPYNTSSSCTIAGIGSSFGIYKFDRVIGVVKAYCTRVGSGPFPSERLDDYGKKLRDVGHEFGSTTGRERRCGDLDIPALRYACSVGGITELAMTKLDVLSSLGKISVVKEYEGVVEDETLTTDLMDNVKVKKSKLSGWGDISGCKDYYDLPKETENYIRFVQIHVGCPITMVGIGPEREKLLVW
jgi:adenylosuccinate synthase